MSTVNISYTNDAYSTSYLDQCPPTTDNDLCGEESFNNYAVPTLALSSISCTLSCVGSIAIILSYACWKDIRTGSRRIVTYLAIADFFTAASYLMGSVNKAVYLNKVAQNKGLLSSACITFDCLCQIQAFISSWSSMSSFIWTSVLALYLFWTIVRSENKTVNRLFPIYHVLAWGFPMVLLLPLLASNKLGYSDIATGGWCYIRTDQNNADEVLNKKLSPLTIALILVGGKAIEIITYVIVIVLYAGVFCSIRREKRMLSSSSVHQSAVIRALLNKVELKLYAIPFLFIFIRMWGTIQFIFSIIVSENGGIDSNGCVMSHKLYIAYFALAVLQAIGDGAQGWVNGILYIIFSPKIRERLFIRPFCCCFSQIVSYFETTHQQTLVSSSKTLATTSPINVGEGSNSTALQSFESHPLLASKS